MSRVPSREGRDRTWWTRERVREGLLRYFREHDEAPLSTEAWLDRTRSPVKGPTRRYPSFSSVLKYFTSFREAWESVGVETDRSWEPWSESEDWYLREANGILTREQIAIDLHRTPSAVHRRLFDLGLNAYRAKGWSPHRIEAVCGISWSTVRRYMARGELPYLQGSHCTYVDPADLLVVEDIDWTCPPGELEIDVRRALIGRMVTILSGGDWRVGRPYQAHRTRTTTHYWRRMTPEPHVPRPQDLQPGARVRCVGALKADQRVQGREGIIKAVFYRAHRAGLDQPGRVWVARVEFPKLRHVGDQPRVHYTVPLTSLEPVTVGP